MEAQIRHTIDDINLCHIELDDLDDEIKVTALILAKSDYYRQVRFPLRLWIERLLNEIEFRKMNIVRSELLDPDCSDIDHIIFWRMNIRSYQSHRIHKFPKIKSFLR